MKTISIVTPCYNEEGNVYNMHISVKNVMKKLPQYNYEHIFIDNCSTDNSAEILKKIAFEDKNVKVILNVRNFGPDRSGGYAVLQATGDAVIGLACDFQDPPEMIPEFIKKWEEGYKVVFGQKYKSEESGMMFFVRTLYYRIIERFSSVDQLEHVTGFGLYDKTVIDIMKWMDNPEPYFRGTIAELGYDVGLIQYVQPKRMVGKSSYNLFSYIDTAINGMINSSKAPLRIATYFGSIMSFICIMVALVFIIIKILNGDSFQLGVSLLVTGLFFMGSVQIAFIGILGEYLGAVLTRVTKRPLVVEKERINFNVIDFESEVKLKDAEGIYRNI